MRKWFLPLLLLTSASLFSQEKSYWDYHPIHGGVNFITFGKADVDAPQGGELLFRKSNAFLYMLVPISRTSFFLPRVEYNTFTLDWNHNPKFHETRFDYMQFALTFITHAVDQWRWIVRASYNMDVEHFGESRYNLFSALLWGRNQIHRKWHYHVGALGYRGMEGQTIYPLIGIEFEPNAVWSLRAIFPIDYAFEYKINKEWCIAIKGRPMKERFRTDRREPQPRSIFSYSTLGTELNLHYERFLRLEFEVYVGYNFGGDFYIKNQGGHKALYTDVETAPYGGAQLNFGF